MKYLVCYDHEVKGVVVVGEFEDYKMAETFCNHISADSKIEYYVKEAK